MATSTPTTKTKKGFLTHTQLARQYTVNHSIDTMYARSQWHRYASGVWKPTHDLSIGNEIWQLLERFEQSKETRPTKGAKESVLDRVKTQLFVPEDQLDASPRLVNLRNGVYSLDDNKLYPHDPKYYMTTQLPFDYDETAKAPNWMCYVQTTFVDPQNGHDAELAAFVQEALGYSLTTDVEYHVTFWCKGEGRNGKGVLFHVLEKLGGDAAMAFNIGLLKREQYHIALLAGKRIAFCTESKSNENLVEDEIVKAIVAGDTIQARMIRGIPFNLHPTAKLWWSMNTFPDVTDTSDGFWSRIKVIPFNRNFDKEPEIKDIRLKDKLDNELPGIFNWAMDGLKRLRGSGKFTSPQQVGRETTKYRNDSDIIKGFIEECCTVGSGLKETTNGLYQAYHQWARASGYKPKGKKNFKLEMIRHGHPDKDEMSNTYYVDVEIKRQDLFSQAMNP